MITKISYWGIDEANKALDDAAAQFQSDAHNLLLPILIAGGDNSPFPRGYPVIMDADGVPFAASIEMETRLSTMEFNAFETTGIVMFTFHTAAETKDREAQHEYQRLLTLKLKSLGFGVYSDCRIEWNPSALYIACRITIDKETGKPATNEDKTP